jgi:hypothetical protein
VADNILIYVANRGIATGVATRSVIPSGIGLANWTNHARVTTNVLIRAADRGDATGFAPRRVVSDHVGFPSWASNAGIT